MFTSNFSETFARVTVGIIGTTLCAGLCLMGAAAPAAATTPVVDAQSISISHADLDLGSAADRAELDQRIARGARKVCASIFAGTRGLGPEGACVQSAINAARAQLSAKTARAGA